MDTPEQTPEEKPEDKEEVIEDFYDLEHLVAVTGYGNRRTVQVKSRVLIDAAQNVLGIMSPLSRNTTAAIIATYAKHSVITKTNYDVLAKNLLTIEEEVRRKSSDEAIAMFDKAKAEHARMVRLIELRLKKFDEESAQGNVRFEVY